MASRLVNTNIDIAPEYLNKIEYSSNGRMKYNPEYFGKTGEPWYQQDLQYLKDWYDITGPEEMAFALERTPDSVMEKARKLRKEGVMIKPIKTTRKERALGKEPK